MKMDFRAFQFCLQYFYSKKLQKFKRKYKQIIIIITKHIIAKHDKNVYCKKMYDCDINKKK